MLTTLQVLQHLHPGTAFLGDDELVQVLVDQVAAAAPVAVEAVVVGGQLREVVHLGGLGEDDTMKTNHETSVGVQKSDRLTRGTNRGYEADLRGIGDIRQTRTGRNRGYEADSQVNQVYQTDNSGCNREYQTEHSGCNRGYQTDHRGCNRRYQTDPQGM